VENTLAYDAAKMFHSTGTIEVEHSPPNPEVMGSSSTNVLSIRIAYGHWPVTTDSANGV